MSDLDLEAIKARAAAATPGPWAQGMAGDKLLPEVDYSAAFGFIIVDAEHSDDGSEGVADARFIANAREDIDALVAEVEQLRAVEMAVKRACTHDAHCEEEGEGACCFRAWRAVVLAAGCAQAVTHEDVELLAALHPQEPSDE